MKSSKLENIFNYNPPAEDAKTLSPFTYYQPFHSTFDPHFSVPQPKAITTRQAPPQGDRRSGERPGGVLQMPGGALEDGGFCPRPSVRLPVASTSGWGDPEARSLCNTTWRSPRPALPGDQAKQPVRARSVGADGVAGGSGLGAGLPTGAPLCQSPAQVASLTQSSYYPLMLSPLGKKMAQNVYKTGHSRPMVCNFCKNNKEVPDIYLNHYLYDPETKVLSCPVLRKHVCEICGGTGDQAHTLQYCPVNRERGLQSKVPVLLKTRTITNSTGKIRRN